MSIKSGLLIETTTTDALSRIFSKNQIAPGDHISAPDIGTRLTLDSQPAAKGFGVGESVKIVFEILKDPAITITTSVIASWLYDQLSGRARKVEYAQQTYRITQEDLEKMVQKLVAHQTSQSAAKQTVESPTAPSNQPSQDRDKGE